MRRAAAVLSFCLLILTGAMLLPSGLSAAQLGFTLDFFNTVVDEQTHIGCPNPPLLTSPYATGDNTSDPSSFGATSAYNVAPWQSETGLSSVAYTNGADCNPHSATCLAVNLDKSQTVLSIDSRLSQDPTTGKPRALRLDFSQPCLYCAYGPGPTNPLGTDPFSTPGLFSVFLTSPYTSMAVCSTTDCVESEVGTVRFWFTDASGTQWRLDWGSVRVLRISSSTWYVLADGCDGSQVATLYKSKNKGGSLSRLGQYVMPFFVSAVH